MFEPKWDGIRLLVESNGSDMTLRTRSGRTIDHRAFREPPARHPVVLDGELVAFDELGVPRFGLLQRGVGSIAYMVFDILYDGTEVIDEPLENRLDRLARLTFPPPFVRSEAIPAEGEALFSAAGSNGLEGIVARATRLSIPTGSPIPRLAEDHHQTHGSGDRRGIHEWRRVPVVDVRSAPRRRSLRGGSSMGRCRRYRLRRNEPHRDSRSAGPDALPVLPLRGRRGAAA